MTDFSQYGRLEMIGQKFDDKESLWNQYIISRLEWYKGRSYQNNEQDNTYTANVCVLMQS